MGEVATHSEFPHDLNGSWYVSETHHNVPPDYQGTRPVLGFQFPYYNQSGQFPQRHGLMQRAEMHYFRRGEQILKLLSVKYMMPLPRCAQQGTITPPLRCPYATPMISDAICGILT